MHDGKDTTEILGEISMQRHGISLKLNYRAAALRFWTIQSMNKHIL